MFQSFIYETQNCSTVASCLAMEAVHEIMNDVCMTETEKAIEVIMVDFDSDGSITFTL